MGLDFKGSKAFLGDCNNKYINKLVINNEPWNQ